MKKYSVLILVAVVAAIFLYALWPPEDNENAGVDPLFQNNTDSVDFAELPSGWAQVSETIYRFPLGKIESKEETRFRRITDSGIKFSNYFDRNRAVELLDTGSGVALGDYDNDGLVDVYLVGAEIGNKLYRNLGGFKFENVTLEANVDGRFRSKNTFGSGATFADVDNDGDLDLFVCNMSAPNLLYINQGDGTFLEQALQRGVAYLGASKIANFCDYDQDGDLDFYLVTYQDEKPDTVIDPVEVVDGKKRIKEEFREYYAIVGDGVVKTGERDLLFQNNGDGTFEEVSAKSGITPFGTTLAAVWLDYDRDGWQDIYVSNDFHSPDRLYRNQGDGTFVDVLPDVVKHTPWFSMGNDAGDLNNDGWEDLVTADMSGTSHYRRKVDMGDMGDSGFFLTYGAPRQYMKNAVYINSGVGPFFEIASMAGMSSTDWTWSTRVVDLDNDGWQDVFVTNGHARDIMNADIVAKFDSLSKQKDSKAFQDFYVTIPPRKESNLAFKNLGELKFFEIGKEWGLDHVGISHGAAFSDLDLDGDLDLIVNNYDEKALVYRNDSSQGNRIQFEFRAAENNFFGVGARVEIWAGTSYQSKTLKSARGYLSSDAPVVQFGCGENESIDKVRVTWPDQTAQEYTELQPGFIYRVIESKDRSRQTIKENEGKTLFVESAAVVGLDFVHREKPFDDFERENLLPYKLSELGAGVSWGDVNQDGWPDLYCGGASGQSGQLFVNQKGKSFRRLAGPWENDAEHEDMAALFLDYDGDGNQDLLVISGGNEWSADDPRMKDRVYRNAGDGKFERVSGVIPEHIDSGSCVAAADFDRDGDLDLFIGGRSVPGLYPESPISRLLRNDGGKFTEVTTQVATGLNQIGLVNSALWSDYDQDGWVDLVLALDWGPVTVLKNNEGEFSIETTALGLDEHQGWWHGLTAGDFDNDGDVDWIVTNFGTNTKYHADRQHPHRMYYSDFDNSGTLDLVETEFEGGVEYPARGLSCSSNSMPFIGEKFKSYHEFASASLLEVYEPTIREKPFRQVNYLESAIFWNQVDEKGKFEVQPLPNLAQISPAFGVVVADLDEDEQLDLFLANNFFASQPETGFMDGGLSLMLKGTGQGFEPVWPTKSGVAIQAAAYGAAVADFDADGDLDIAISTNNDRVRLLDNQHDPASRVRIELRGSKGNPAAVGAQLTLVGDDFKRTFESYAGGSYLSQAVGNEFVINEAISQKLKHVEVRWPDGSESKYDWQAGNNELVLFAKTGEAAR